MINIAVVEDTNTDFETLKSHIGKYSEKFSLKYELKRFFSAEELIESYRPVYDIIFMDVGLKGADGLTAAAKLRETDGESLIIFFTTMAQLAVKGYAVNAFDYLVKPLDYASFELSFKRAVADAERRKGKKLSIATADGTEIIASSDIKYIEIYDHRLIYHTGEREIYSWGNLKKLEKELADFGFVRCNSCYLVNLKYVGRCEGDKIFVGEEALHISRAGMSM